MSLVLKVFVGQECGCEPSQFVVVKGQELVRRLAITGSGGIDPERERVGHFV